MGGFLIRAERIDVWHGARHVLCDVSLEVRAGEVLALVGPNGSGKTTLLRALIGALSPSRGRIGRARDLRVGYVPQRLAIDGTLPLTVRRFLSLPCPVCGHRAGRELERSGIAHLRDRQMSALSGGQFQRVLLARAMLARPNLLVLDEAAQGLDGSGSAGFYRRVVDARRELGCAVLMVSHELQAAMAVSDRVVYIDRHVCREGTPEAVASSPECRGFFGLPRNVSGPRAVAGRCGDGRGVPDLR